MSEPGELSFSASRNKRAQHASPTRLARPAFGPREVSPPAPPELNGKVTEKPTKLAVDPWRLAGAFKKNWHWMMGAAAGMAVIAFLTGFFCSNYKTKVTLVSRDAAVAASSESDGEAYRPHRFTPQTLINLMGSSELASRVAAKAQPTISAGILRGRIRVEPVKDTELVALTVIGKDRRTLVDLANLYANEAVDLGKELETAESRGMNEFCADKLVALDKEVQEANDEFIKFQNQEKMVDPDAERQAYIKQLGEIMARTDNLRIEAEMAELQTGALQTELAQQNPIAQKLQTAKNKLSDLLTRLTEAHPYVQGQRKEIAELEKQLSAAGPNALASAKYTESSLGSTLYLRLVEFQTKKVTLQKELLELDKLKQSLQDKVTGLSEKGLRYANLKARLDGLKKSRASLSDRQRETQLSQSNAQGYYRVFAPASVDGVDTTSRWFAAFLAGIAGAVVGVLGAGLVIGAWEIRDGRLKTASDVERVTGLPVLASLGDLKKMSLIEQEAWAFRTWTALSGQLNSSPNQGMVCGFISSSSGEGCSTWVNLLVNAANRRGLRAGAVTTQRAPAETETTATETNGSETCNGNGDVSAHFEGEASLPALRASLTEVLVTPASAQISLPGSVWNLEHRKQWQNTLSRCRAMNDVVLLVDLPPASVAEAVLLAENLPQLIWLADSGKSRTRATREQLKTLRHARCRLVGAVLNHEPNAVFEL